MATKSVDQFLDKGLGVVILMSFIGIVITSVTTAENNSDLSTAEKTLIGLVVLIFIYAIIKWVMSMKK